MDKTAELEALASEVEIDETPTLSGLAAIVWQQWQINSRHRNDEIDGELEECHLMRAARYSDRKEQEILATGGESVYAPLASMQSISGAASVSQVVLTPNERSWSISPTPIPELPPEVVSMIAQQLNAERGTITPGPMIPSRKEELEKAQRAKLDAEAKAGAEAMTRKIDDQLVDSGFYNTMVQIIDDFATYPYAVLKRVTVREPVLEWRGGKPKRVERVKDVDIRVSPFDIYPSPGMTDVNDGPIIERLRLRDYELAKHRGVKGFDSDAIDRVLSYHPGRWLFDANDAIRNDAEDNSALNTESKDDLIDVLRYWGQIEGSELARWGIQDVEDGQYYDTEIWLCGSDVLRVARNPHPLDHRPYYKATWRSIPGQFWGSAPPSQAKHLQHVCNGAMRALIKNMSVAAGPQVVIMIDQLPKGQEEITSIYPLQVWQMVSKAGVSQAPVTFFQPSSNAKELIGVFQHYWELAGDVTGIYRWNYGADQGMQGAAQTAIGLSMLLENSNKVIRQAVSNLEEGVLRRRIYDQFLINMIYENDEKIKGDIDVVVRGSSSIIERASIRQRRTELLQAINNSPESQMPGMDALIAKIRMAILVDTAKDLDIEADRFPTNDTIDKLIDQYMQQKQQQQQPQDPRVEAAMIAYKSRIEDQKLEMEDREKQREHTLKIETMRLDGLRMQSEQAGNKSFEAKKMDMTARMLDLKQKQAQFNQEMDVKRTQGSGI